MGGQPTGTVTFLFTDIEGSTPLWDAHPLGMRSALARHDEIVRKAIDAAGGHVFSTGGDGFAAAFSGAGPAVAAALDAQRELAAEPWPDGLDLKVRMGIHSGEVDERGSDYFGPAVNRAARLMGAANGGQVVASDVVVGLLDPGADIDLIDLGEVRLKGLVEPVHVYGASATGVPWSDVPLVSEQRSAGNLPRPQTELVGDLVDLQRRVASLGDNRLVTLTGSGGVGKTRAAIEIGWLVVDEFPDGVWVVDLAPIADPDLVAGAVASVLGVQPQPEMSLVESIIDWCDRRRVLLILDNCEHILVPVTEIVAALVEASPAVTILATSREPLGTPGEQVVRVPSLSDGMGVELFRMRAAAAGAQLATTAADEDAVAHICARLDGIPLAIELAAARTRALSPQELLGRLDDRFRLLRGGGRGMERHQTLRATVTWSYHLLPDQHRLLFDRLSVFAGGFDLAAVEAVCPDDFLDEIEAIDLLGELVDKSMVQAEREGMTTRYRMLETLRQFGEERLDERGETALLRDRHLAHFWALAERLADQWESAEATVAVRSLDLEWGNLRAAHGWAITNERLADAAHIAFHITWVALPQLRHEVSGWVDQTLELGDRLGLEDARIALAGAVWAFHLAQPDRSFALCERALSSGAKDDERLAASATGLWVVSGRAAGRDVTDAVAEAQRLLEVTTDPIGRVDLGRGLLDLRGYDDEIGREGVEVVVEAGARVESPFQRAEVARVRGNRAFFDRDSPTVVIEAFEEAVALAEPVRAVVTVAWSLGGIAATSALAGADDAPQRLADGLRYAVDLHYPLVIDTAIAFDSLYLAGRGATAAAARGLGFCERRPADFRAVGDWVDLTRAALADQPDIDRLVEQGRAMTRSEITAVVLRALDEL